jgi:hypothetical protein
MFPDALSILVTGCVIVFASSRPEEIMPPHPKNGAEGALS